MKKNDHFKYTRKKGRPEINVEYIFSNEKYMWIIFLIHNCEKFKRQPQFMHLKYALVENFNTESKVLKKFFDIKPISLDKDILVENLQYHTLVTWDSKQRRKNYRDILSLNIDYVKTFLEHKYNKEFDDEAKKIHDMDVISKLFMDLINKLNNLKELEKPFEKWNDLWKYITHLKRLDLITTDNKKRNASYKLTEKFKDYLYKLHIEHLQYIMIQKIKNSHYTLIEKNYFDFMSLF